MSNYEDKIRFAAGQPVPADVSHFTIDYTENGQPRRLDGWLKDDDVAILKPSGG